MRPAVVSLVLLATMCIDPRAVAAEQTQQRPSDPFRQLEAEWPAPSAYRSASGAPGPAYWQQQVDYEIEVILDESRRAVSGSERITYRNNSPDHLSFLWLQLDQNRYKRNSIDTLTRTIGQPPKLTYADLRHQQFADGFHGGMHITEVRDERGKPLPHRVVGTLMRVDLPQTLGPGKSIRIRVSWHYNLVDTEASFSHRDGYEHFPADGNDIFLVAQWYPRMAAYSDYEGWHTKEFIGAGEFTLEFGDFDVRMTVPADHVVAATGVLQNPAEVLTAIQRQRLTQARTAEHPIFIVTPAEALENEGSRTQTTRTWHFSATNVRDFAWATSRKFIWDAQGHQQNDRGNPLVMAMSFYPKEGEPLWSRYSTRAVIHTMEVYSRYTFAYPYPAAQSVNGAAGGIEYPMITFNGPRTALQEDGKRTYPLSEKFSLIAAVLHEIGHTYFPMVVNSDERQWAWMDEGMNSFLQYLAQKAWDDKFESYRGEPRWITDYMKAPNQVPIMTSADSVIQLPNNAYAKPAAALTILRETILGRDPFDFAFKEYAQRWKFRRPTPSDFFRSMEEASGVDLDWFWRGWFYTTDHVDISLERVTRMKLDAGDPDIEFPLDRQAFLEQPLSRTRSKNAEEGYATFIERHPELRDFYDEHDQFTVSNKDRNEFQDYLESLRSPLDPDPGWRLKVRERAIAEDWIYFILQFRNAGELVMPIILRITYDDDSIEEMRIPAEVWRYSPRTVSKLIRRKKEIREIVVDPYLETADVDLSNNHYPRRIDSSRVEVQLEERTIPGIRSRNLMHDIEVELRHKTDHGEHR